MNKLGFAKGTIHHRHHPCSLFTAFCRSFTSIDRRNNWQVEQQTGRSHLYSHPPVPNHSAALSIMKTSWNECNFTAGLLQSYQYLNKSRMQWGTRKVETYKWCATPVFKGNQVLLLTLPLKYRSAPRGSIRSTEFLICAACHRVGNCRKHVQP